jgi:hypothetical protein
MPEILAFADGKPHPAHVEWLQWASLLGCKTTLVTEVSASGQSLFNLGRYPPPDSTVLDGNPVAESLFAAPSGSTDQPHAIWTMPDALQEVEHVLRDVGKQLAAGCPEERLTIVARSSRRYGPLLTSAARRFGISLHSSARAELKSQRIIQLVSAILDAFAENKVRDMRGLLRSSYFGIRSDRLPEALDACRNAEATNDWAVLASWARENAKTLGLVLEWRSEFANGERSLNEWINLLSDLICDLDIVDSVPLSVADREGFVVNAAERDLYAYASMRANADPVSLRVFASLCRKVWDAGTCSIPTEGGVRVVSSASAIQESEAVYVLGMLEGSFPKRPTEDGIVNDELREWLKEGGFAVLPQSLDNAQAERDELYRLAVSSPRVVFTHPATDDESEQIPSLYLDDLARTGLFACRTFGVSDLAPADSPFERDALLSNALGSVARPLEEVRFEDLEQVQELFGDPPDLFSPEELRDVLRCPFQHFARHRLHLKSELVRERWQSFANLGVEAQLAAASDATEAHRSLTSTFEARLDKFRGVVPDWEYRLLEAGGQRLIEELVTREFELRDRWPRNTVQFGVPFGEGPLRLQVSGVAPVTFEIDQYRALSLTQSYFRNLREGEAWTSDELLYYGLLLLTQLDRASGLECLIEIDTLSGKRIALRTKRHPKDKLPLNGPLFEKVDLFDDNTGFRQVNDLRKEAIRTIAELNIRPVPGPACRNCPYGELCRHSQEHTEDFAGVSSA